MFGELPLQLFDLVPESVPFVFGLVAPNVFDPFIG
jgi:hypothetical protein